MIWTLNKATDDILITLENARLSGLYNLGGRTLKIKDINVIGMAEDKECYIFTLAINAEEPITWYHQTLGYITKTKTLTKNIKYRKVREKSIADWDDD